MGIDAKSELLPGTLGLLTSHTARSLRLGSLAFGSPSECEHLRANRTACDGDGISDQIMAR